VLDLRRQTLPSHGDFCVLDLPLEVSRSIFSNTTVAEKKTTIEYLVDLASAAT